MVNVLNVDHELDFPINIYTPGMKFIININSLPGNVIFNTTNDSNIFVMSIWIVADNQEQ